MKQRSRFTFAAILLILGLTGCRPSVPDVSGKWHGTASLPDNHKQKVAADILLVLSQQDRAVHGDASLKMDHSRTAIHVPITTAAISPDGKLQLEGSAPAAMGEVHFSFDGATTATTLAGTATITAQMMLFGTETDTGPVTLTKVR